MDSISFPSYLRVSHNWKGRVMYKCPTYLPLRTPCVHWDTRKFVYGSCLPTLLPLRDITVSVGTVGYVSVFYLGGLGYPSRFIWRDRKKFEVQFFLVEIGGPFIFLWLTDLSEFFSTTGFYIWKTQWWNGTVLGYGCEEEVCRVGERVSTEVGRKVGVGVKRRDRGATISVTRGLIETCMSS